MYGILAGCIAIMGLFLGLFAMSVGADTNNQSAGQNSIAEQAQLQRNIAQ